MIVVITFSAVAAARPNVLFIAVDDLRPELGCYGKAHMHSPHLDRLAREGVLFERSYCMVPTCGASRASLMTGLRPANNRFVNYLTWAERDAAGVTTLNTHFKHYGYRTLSLGKVFHHAQDNAPGWSEPPWRPKSGGMDYLRPENQQRHRENAQTQTRPTRGPPFESADVPDEAYADGQIAARAVADLRRLAESEQPFFLAVGFYKPHLPFNAPEKYWRLYDPEDIRVPDNYYPPQDAPPGAVHTFGELRAYDGIPGKGLLDAKTARQLIHGYYACVSFTDAQVGKLLRELDQLNLTASTIVILWGDHGWNLGEHTLWCKHCTFETSMHAPLLIRAPGFPAGGRTPGLTEFIDIYPSLCELAGLPPPDHLQGLSFVPLLRNPTQTWKTSAIGRYRNGDTIRTDHLRFTQYRNPQGQPAGRMLYDHGVDPDENRNVAEQPAYRDAVSLIRKQLDTGMGQPNP